MKLDFPVAIQRKTVAVSERGFGTILIYDTETKRNYELIDENSILEMDKNKKAYKIASRLFMQKPKPQQVAIVGYGAEMGTEAGVTKAIEENQDFFYLVTTDNTTQTVKKLASLAQTQNKVYGVTVNDYAQVKALKDEVGDNVFIMYHDDPDSYVAEALCVIMSYKIGGKTAKFKTVQGVKSANVSITQLNELHKSNMFTYIEKLGVLQTTEGTMMSGEYIDVVLGEYWIRFRMEEALQRLAIVEDKIPYTNRGIGMLVGEVEKVLTRAVDQGIVEVGQYKVRYKLREDVPSNEVALRKYNYVEWVAMLQGAIHSGQISGILTYDIVNDGKEGNR